MKETWKSNNYQILEFHLIIPNCIVKRFILFNVSVDELRERKLALRVIFSALNRSLFLLLQRISKESSDRSHFLENTKRVREIRGGICVVYFVFMINLTFCPTKFPFQINLQIMSNQNQYNNIKKYQIEIVVWFPYSIYNDLQASKLITFRRLKVEKRCLCSHSFEYLLHLFFDVHQITGCA